MKPFVGSHTGSNITKEMNAKRREIWNVSGSKRHLVVRDSENVNATM